MKLANNEFLCKYVISQDSFGPHWGCRILTKPLVYCLCLLPTAQGVNKINDWKGRFQSLAHTLV